MSIPSKFLPSTRLAAIWLAVSSVVALSCALSPTFTGEAEFTDKGRSSYWPRFEIRFPAISLSTSTVYSYQLDEIPRTVFDLRMIPVKNGATLVPGKLSGPLEEFDRFWDLATESNLLLRFRVMQDSTTLLDTGNHVFSHGWSYGVKGGSLPFLQPLDSRLESWTNLTVEFTVEAGNNQEVASVELIPILVGGGKDSW